MGYRQLTMWWKFQMQSKTTQPYMHMFSFSPDSSQERVDLNQYFSYFEKNRFHRSVFLKRIFVVPIQSLSCVWLFVTPWTITHQTPLFSTISQSLLKFMSTESMMLSNHLILGHPLLLLPSVILSVRVFSSELALHTRWSKYWSFSFSIRPSREYSGLISFKIDWFDLLHV